MKLTAVIAILLLCLQAFGQVNTESLRTISKDGYSGELKASANMQSGNVSSTLMETSTRVDYRRGGRHLFASVSYSRGEASDKAFKDEGFAHLRWSEMFGKVGFELFTQGEYDQFKALKVRQLNGAYLRIAAESSSSPKADIFSFAFGVGLMSDYEALNGGGGDGLVARGTSYLTFQNKISESIFTLVGYYQPRINVADDFRFLVVAKAELKLGHESGSRGLWVEPKYTFAYDSAPPTEVYSLDRALITSLKLRW